MHYTNLVPGIIALPPSLQVGGHTHNIGTCIILWDFHVVS